MATMAIILITITAFTHAGWNLICKAKAPSAAFFLMLAALSVLLFSPAYFLYPEALASFPARFWLLLALTGLCQTVYYVTLANAYRLCEISVAYPMIRSIPVVLVPLVTVIFGFGATPSFPVFIGIFLVFAGCMVLPLKKFSELLNMKRYWDRSFLLIITSAVFIAGYTVIDREALRLLEGHPELPGKFSISFLFAALENTSILCFIVFYVLFSKTERKNFRILLKEDPWMPIPASVLCSGGYMLVLTAMLYVSNVSYIVAFRQLSIPVGAVLGIILLHESLKITKATGLLLIVAGLILVALF